MRTVFLLITYLLSLVSAQAETSDSMIVRQMREYGVHFTNDNNDFTTTTDESAAGLDFMPA